MQDSTEDGLSDRCSVDAQFALDSDPTLHACPAAAARALDPQNIARVDHEVLTPGERPFPAPTHDLSPAGGASASPCQTVRTPLAAIGKQSHVGVSQKLQLPHNP